MPYPSSVLGPRYVYYVYVKDPTHGLCSALPIRIFSFQHISTNFEVDISSHGLEFRETTLIYIYLLYIHYLWL